MLLAFGLQRKEVPMHVHAVIVNLFVGNYGENSQITAFANSVANFVVYGLGSFLFVLGMAKAGFAMKSHDADGIRQGVMTIAGGSLMLMSKSIWETLTNWSGF
jgi:hypothetical protein